LCPLHPSDYQDIAHPTLRQLMSLGSGQIQTLDLRLSPRADFNSEDVDFSRFPQLIQLAFCSVSDSKHPSCTEGAEAAPPVRAPQDTVALVVLPLEKIICHKCPRSHQESFYKQYNTTSFAVVFLKTLQLVSLPCLTSLQLHDAHVKSPWLDFSDPSPVSL
jgi:hypothetical protein